MAEYDFTLILSDDIRDFTDDQANALYEAGCDDATIARRRGRVYVTFSREAECCSAAIISAINDVRRANICTDVLRVDRYDLVTQAEIARRINRTRQAVGLYISGSRGPGSFPPPVCNVVNGQPLWHWCEVANWLFRQDMISEADSIEAQEIAAINALLEQKHLQSIAPEITERLSRHTDQSADRAELQDA